MNERNAGRSAASEYRELDHRVAIAHIGNLMKALVTGASGFVGSQLIRELNGRGLEVFALMRKTSRPTNVEGIQFERREGDLRDLESLKTAVRGMDVVYHVAGAVTAPNRETFFEHNARGAERVARAVAECAPEVKRMVLVSSLAAGGPARGPEPRREGEADQPISWYGESKLEGERLVLAYRDRVPVAIVRPPMVYGPRDKGTFLFVKAANGGIVPMFKGATPDGQKYYTAIHVADLARGIADAGLASVSQVPSGEVLYLTDDQVFSYEEMMRIIASKLGKKMRKLHVPVATLKVAAVGMDLLGKITGRTYPLNRDKLNEITPDYWTCSAEKAKRMLGFEAKHDLESGWADAVDWYRKSGWL